MNFTADRANPVPAWCYAALWQGWLLCLSLFAAFPGLRAGSQWLGAGSFWLLLAPLASLAVLYRRALVTSLRRATVARSWHRPAPRPGRHGR